MASNYSMLSICSIFLFVFSVVAAESQVIGGHNAQKDQLPYMAGIFRANGGAPEPICNGIILNNRVILSSAACINDADAELNELVAILGSPLTDGDEFFNVVFAPLDQITIHPQFNSGSKAFDLSLIRTKEEIEFSNAVQPIALPKTDLSNNKELQAIISGWELSSKDSDSQIAHQVQLLQTSIISREKCLSMFKKIAGDDVRQWNVIKEQLTKNNLCTLNSSDEDLSIGDGGGPLVVDGVVVGVASRILKLPTPHPNVYTKTYPNLKWIQTEMDKMVGKKSSFPKKLNSIFSNIGDWFHKKSA